jgi:hypothetical protein
VFRFDKRLARRGKASQRAHFGYELLRKVQQKGSMIKNGSQKWALTFALACIISGCGEREEIIPRANNAFVNKSARMCLSELQSNNINFSPLPNKNYGGGCSANNAVTLLDIGTKVTNLGPMTCTLAAGFADWTRDVVHPAARKHLGSKLARVETSGTYSCRKVSGSGSLSQHAYANAVDVYAFVTEDGRRVSVLAGWHGSKGERAFLRELHAKACGQFGTVLGPAYNRQHANHFHLDMAASRMGGKSFCR